MRNRMLLSVLALVVLALATLPAAAQVRATYLFTDNSGNAITGTPSFGVGVSFTWRVYMLDNNTFTQAVAPANVTVGPAPAPFLNALTTGGGGTNVPGISGAAVTVASTDVTKLTVQSNPPPPVTTTGNSSVTPAGAIPPWQTWSNNGSQVNSIHLNVGVFNGSVTAPTTGTDAGRVLLGTYSFTTVAPGTVSLTASDANTQPGDTTWAGNFSSLDTSIGNGSVSLTVTGVPEPGSMLLCGLGAVGLAAYRRRARKTAAVEAAA